MPKGKPVYVCSVQGCGYESNRGMNMERHLTRVHEVDEPEVDEHYAFYTDEHSRVMANAKNLADGQHREMELDLEPYLNHDIAILVADHNSMLKLSELEHLMVQHKYEQLVGRFYNGQFRYDDGEIYYSTGNRVLKDSDYYNLWHSLVNAYAIWKAQHTSDTEGLTEATRLTFAIADDRTAKSTKIKRIREFVAHSFASLL